MMAFRAPLPKEPDMNAMPVPAYPSRPAVDDRRRRPGRVEVPELPPGTVISLDGSDWSYGRGQQPGTRLTIVVCRVRTELSAYYGGEWSWIDGHTPVCEGGHAPCRQALVRTAALLRAAPPLSRRNA
jgi:hypothetical protein